MESNFGRTEYKYYLPFHRRAHFLADLRKFTTPDQHATGRNLSYEVVSIYFDNLELKSYHEKLSGDPRKVKLRVRFYPPLDNTGSVNIELKYKMLDNTIKKRTKIAYESFLDTLQSDFAKLDFDGQDPVISSLACLIRADTFYPFIRVDYRRSAFYARNDHNVRITIDSEVLCNRWLGGMNIMPHIPVLPAGVEVLEIKSPNYFPFWLTYIIQKYALSRAAISKYALSVQNLAVNSSLFVK